MQWSLLQPTLYSVHMSIYSVQCTTLCSMFSVLHSEVMEQSVSWSQILTQTALDTRIEWDKDRLQSVVCTLQFVECSIFFKVTCYNLSIYCAVYTMLRTMFIMLCTVYPIISECVSLIVNISYLLTQPLLLQGSCVPALLLQSLCPLHSPSLHFSHEM